MIWASSRTRFRTTCGRVIWRISKKTPPKPGSAPHKQMGALAALEDLRTAAEMFALPIYGHHGGMVMPSETRNKVLGKDRLLPKSLALRAVLRK